MSRLFGPSGLWIVNRTLDASRRERQLGDDWLVRSFRQNFRGLQLDRIVIEDSRYVRCELGDTRYRVEFLDLLRSRLRPGCEDNLLEL